MNNVMELFRSDKIKILEKKIAKKKKDIYLNKKEDFKKTLDSIKSEEDKKEIEKEKIEELEELLKKLLKGEIKEKEALKLLTSILNFLKKGNSLNKLLDKLNIKRESFLAKLKELKKFEEFINNLKELLKEKGKIKKKLIVKFNQNNEEVIVKEEIKELLKNIKEKELNFSKKEKLKEKKLLKPFKLVSRYNKRLTFLEKEKREDDLKSEINLRLQNSREIFKITSKNLKNILYRPSFRHNLITNIIQKIKLYLGRGRNEMRLFLKPETLGTLNLKLTWKNKNLVAKFIVENSAIKEIIEGSLNQLKNSFQALGMELGEIKVMVSLDGGKDLNKKRDSDFKKIIKDSKEENEIDYEEVLWLERLIDYVA